MSPVLFWSYSLTQKANDASKFYYDLKDMTVVHCFIKLIHVDDGLLHDTLIYGCRVTGMTYSRKMQKIKTSERI